jgi:hypothetical protein
MLRTVTVRGLVVIGLLSVFGCGSADPRKHVAGSVTFGGQPIVYGVMEFVPDKAKDHSGPAGSAEIVDGKFDTSQGGQGIFPGPHLVRISAMEERPIAGSADETVVSQPKPPLFSGYVIEATVNGGPQDFDVPESAKGFGLGSGAPVRRANDP